MTFEEQTLVTYSEGSYMHIDWTDPVLKGTNITVVDVNEYRVEAKVADSVLVWFNLYFCAGNDEDVIEETACQVPISSLVGYGFESGETFQMRLVVFTDQGESILSEGANATMPVEPDAPINLRKDARTSFMASETSMTLSIKWEEPENDGGTSVIDYRIKMKAPEQPWEEIAVNLPFT